MYLRLFRSNKITDGLASRYIEGNSNHTDTISSSAEGELYVHFPILHNDMCLIKHRGNFNFFFTVSSLYG
jgi:hypothetical protein